MAGYHNEKRVGALIKKKKCVKIYIYNYIYIKKNNNNKNNINVHIKNYKYYCTWFYGDGKIKVGHHSEERVWSSHTNVYMIWLLKSEFKKECWMTAWFKSVVEWDDHINNHSEYSYHSSGGWTKTYIYIKIKKVKW